LQHIPSGVNKQADDIAKRASRREPQSPGDFEERLFRPIAAPPATDVALLIQELPPAPSARAPDCGPTSAARLLLALEPQEHSWVAEFKTYLLHGTLPEEDAEADRVARQATAYCLQDGELYRKRPNGVLLWCISEEQGRELLADVHGEDCGHHSSSRTLAGKAFRSGFYWPTVLRDAAELVRSCEACQFHAKQIHQPAQELQTIPLSWPFAVWGLDILGSFSRAAAGYRYLYVAIDKFTKWAEVEPVRTIPAGSAVKFIRGLVSRFGVPNRIITDNGSQFTSALFKSYCANLGTQICYASVAHPRSNGQAERANAEVLRGLKARSFKKKLEACGKGWLDELQSVLWSIRTTATKPTGETPFFLVYGAEAVLPPELKHGSPRVPAFDEARQDDSRGGDLVLLEEARRQAALRAARY
jgi:transposase InsO family protein